MLDYMVNFGKIYPMKDQNMVSITSPEYRRDTKNFLRRISDHPASYKDDIYFTIHLSNKIKEKQTFGSFSPMEIFQKYQSFILQKTLRKSLEKSVKDKIDLKKALPKLLKDKAPHILKRIEEQKKKGRIPQKSKKISDELLKQLAK